MALNFPDSPVIGQQYTDSTAGFIYEWDGVVWKSFTGAAAPNIKIVDSVEGSFDGIQTIFPLTSSGSSITPINPQQLRVVLGGIVQEPSVDYIVAGSNIHFTTPPSFGLSFSAVLLGSSFTPVGVATAGSVYIRQSYSPTGVQTSFTFNSGYTVGFLEVYRNGVKLVDNEDFTATDQSSFDLDPAAQNGDTIEAIAFLPFQLNQVFGVADNLLVNGNATVLGITTLGNTVVGGGTTQLIVNGDARVTGILTIGTSSITLDGTKNQLNVGTGVTLHHANGVCVGDNIFHSTGLFLNHINVSGVITASSIDATTITGAVSGDATGLTGTPNIVVGIATATTFVGDLNGNIVGYSGTYWTSNNHGSGSGLNADILDGQQGSYYLDYNNFTNTPVAVEAANNGTLTLNVSGTGLSGSATFTANQSGNSTFTVTSNATSSNTGSAIVARDASGDFNAGSVSLSGNLTVSSGNATGGGIILADDGDIVDLNDGYCSMRFSSGVKIYSGNRTGSSVITLGSNGNITATGDITAFYSSDIRLKKDIEPISEPIKKLMEISGVTYKWNEEYLKDKDVDGYFVRETEVGVIAQEVEKVLPEVVATRENGYKAVRYEKLIALLIEAVKDQQHQIDSLRSQLGGN